MSTATQIAATLDALQHKGLLRLLTCGSVDDGKSTLIGRLLHDSGALADDQLATLEKESRRTMPQGGLDFSLLLDGLEAEREQGITIDVAYRYFNTAKRTFIVADTPGHEQYTRNMITGASSAEVALLLVDARKGLLTQTRRHAFLVNLTGIKDVVLVVNKMDMVGHDQAVFAAIRDNFAAYAAEIGLPRVLAIPVSALGGDNVVNRSATMTWYDGPTLLEYLESVQVAPYGAASGLRLPVQTVIRPNQDFRGYAGTIAAGVARVGMSVAVEPGGRTSRIKQILLGDRAVDAAETGRAVTIALEDEVDVSRGEVIADSQSRPPVSDQFTVHMVAMSEQALMPGRPYLVQIGTRQVGAQITHIKHKINVNTLEHTAAKRLELNDVGVCNIGFDRAVPFETYADNRNMGGFIVIDRISNQTVGCGMIVHPLRRADNIHWQSVIVDKGARAALKHQKPCVLWFTGLSGAGKSTVANLVEKRLAAMGRHTYLLDGDNIRHGLNRDLGFTDEDRVENIRRVAEVAKLFVDAGMIVLSAFISPFRAERRLAREMLAEDEFIEIHVDASLETCQGRDPKGLYAKARQGKLVHFTGIDSPYEPPEHPELHLDADHELAESLADRIIQYLVERKYLE
ncbi:sulfate adenylyltransferase subunit CysN [Magnetospirillum sp. 64-120]|uniref:sulfate adenylyltransferase subunit CysN n=1 Tax=Magnetospirillum sp. 64-120 TaxID=1895778 RepID=UPI00092C3BFF|nr:sulfate adenylyltransferase subunit CysN [Magnetospirillum sp. 64-120]OJX68167.1 MAG: adenylyl-sulfate kinase [Magnetospirillum sp. 64-120]